MKQILRLFFALLLAIGSTRAATIEAINGRLTRGSSDEVVLTLHLASERFASLADKAGQEADFNRPALAELIRERLHYLLRLKIGSREVAPTSVEVLTPADAQPLPDFLSITARWAGIASHEHVRVVTQSDVPDYRLELHVVDLRDAPKETSSIIPHFSQDALVSAQSWLRAAGNGALTGLTHLVPAAVLQLLFMAALYFSARDRHELILRLTAFLVLHSLALGLACGGLLQLSESAIRAINVTAGFSLIALAVINCLGKPLPRPLALPAFAIAGVLHGLGLARTFSNTAWPSAHTVAAILGATLSIALALLTMTGVTALFCGARKKPGDWYRPEIAVPASVVIGLTALAWTFGRAQGVFDNLTP